MAKSYGFKNIVCAGLACEKMNQGGSKLPLDFDQQLFTIDQKKTEGVEIGYRDPSVPDSVICIKAQEPINGNKVTFGVMK